MSSVTFPVDLGGNGLTYTDDADPSTGMANGGHETRFIPCVAQAVAMAESAADSAASGHQPNVFLNGNFEIWNESTGAVSCTAGSKTSGPEGWYIQPSGAAVNRSRSTTVRTGARSRYSCELAGATSVTTVLFGTRLEAADIKPIAREVTFQCYVYNGSGAQFTPNLLIGTPAATDDFTTVTNRLTQSLQACADAAWTLVSHTVDISGYTNLANGLQVEFQVPSGSLVSGDTVRFAEPQLKAQATVSPLFVEPMPINETRCERFYEKVQYPSYWLSGVGAGVVALYGPMISFKTRKRVAGTVTLPSSTNQGYNSGGGNVTPTTWTTNTNNTDGFNISAALAGGVAGYIGGTASVNSRLY